MLAHDALYRPVRTLIAVFAAWKLFLLLIAAGSTVGPAYDTSGSITLDAASSHNASAPALLARLTSWDAIYFTQVARRGYLFEQEWAFGSGLTIAIEYTVKSKHPSLRGGFVAALRPCHAAHAPSGTTRIRRSRWKPADAS